MRLFSAILFGLLSLGISTNRAWAQLGFTVQNQATLLGQFSDQAAAVSITPQNIRNVIGSKGGLLDSNTWSGPNTFTGNPITVNPTANTTTQGLVVTQTGPTSGAVSTPLSYNLISVTHQSGVTGAPGTLQASAFRVNYTVGGANLSGSPAIGGYFNTIENISGITNIVDKIGAVGSCLIVVVDTAGGGCYGLNSFAGVASTGSINRDVGFEADVGISTGGTANFRYAYSAVATQPGQGSTLDTAFYIANINSTNAGQFLNLFTLSNDLGQAPLATTADMFHYNGNPTATIGNVFNLPSVTVSTNILNFAGPITLSGNGNLTLSNASATTQVNLTSGAVSMQMYSSSGGGGGSIGTTTNNDFTFQRNAAEVGRFTATNFRSSLGIKSISASAGIGYDVGAGSAVTQITSRTTGVTINTPTGAITLVSAAGSATPSSFTVTNSSVGALDTIVVSQTSGADKYEIFVTSVAAGSFVITSFTTGGTTTEQPVFHYSILKGVSS